MQSNDLLESDQFDPVECLNLLFPNEASLWMVNTVAGNLDDQIRQTDDEIRTVMRTQVDTDSQSMSKMRHAQLAVQDLYSSISTMKQRAESSEDKVLGITHDIKALDSAKRNLVTAVTLLKRLHMLATATEQLYSICERDNYKEAFHLLLAVQELYDFFEEYRQIPEVVELCNNVDSLKRTLSQKIRKEFEAGFNVQGVWTGDKVKLTGACEIMDLVDTADRERMVDTYCSLQLKPYIAIFKPHDEVSSLDNVSRRYAWLRRVLRTHDEEYGTVFPSGWHVAQRLCEKFAITTRNQLADVLKNAQKGLDVGEILRGLQLTRSFEHQLERRFKAALPTPRANPQSQDDNIPKESDTTTSSPFHHIISQCFEPYLSLYTAPEDKKIMTLLEGFKAQSSQVNEDPSMPVLSSASDLLYLYRDALDKCASFSTGKPLLELAHIFAKGLLYYANDVLLGKLPKLYTVDERRPMSHDELTHICWTINTADYCHRSTAQLETKIVNQLDPALADQVQFTAQQDAFLNTIHTSLKSLIRGVESCCESAFSGMLKIPWATLEAVGDQSDYVSMVASAIHLCLGVIRRTLTNDRYIRSFCDKFAEAFTAKFLTTVQRCRQISEVGAEQMLLDIQAIKTVLLDMPGIGMDNPPAPPTRFVKLVNKGVSRVEAVLKTILAPQEPVASIVENFLLLFPEATLGSFYVVLDLKGLKKSEQAPLVEIFKQRASSAACQNTHRALSLTSSTTAALLRGTPADTPTGSAANAILPRNTTPHSEGLPPLSPSDSLPPSLTPASPRPTHLTEHSRWTRPFSPEATYRPALQGTAPSANSLTSPSLPSSSSNRLNHNLRRLMSGMSIRKGGGEGKSF